MKVDIIVQGYQLFLKGGPIMFLLLACSFAVVAIGVERYLYFRTTKTSMETFLDKLSPMLATADWNAAQALCNQSGGVAAMIAVKGITGLQQRNQYLTTVLEGEAALAAARMRENLRHLNTIVTVAPLLGLLGTVLGMIQSFSVLNVKAGQPLAITGGVGEALVATATGLCVAIISLAVYSYFNHLLDKRITDMEQVCTLIIAQAKWGDGHEIA